MENLDLNNLELKTLNNEELLETEGGSLLALGLGILVGGIIAWLVN